MSGIEMTLQFVLTIALIASATALGAPTSLDAGHQVDSLLQSFEVQTGQQALSTAEVFFDLLEKEDFTDEEIDLTVKGKPSEKKAKAMTWYWAGEWYFDLQNYSLSMEYAKKAINLFKSLDDPSSEADCANLLSILCIRLSDYPEALKYAKQDLEIVRSMNDISRISSALNTLAGICLASRQSAEGEKYILEAIKLCEQEKDSLKLAIRYGMAAEIYHSMKREEESLDYSTRAYQIDTAKGRVDKAAIRLSQMSDAYFALGELDKAQDCLDKAMPVLKASGNLQSWAISSNLYGELLLQKGDKEAAAKRFYDALEVFVRLQDSYNESHSRLGLGNALMESDPAESARQMQIYSNLRNTLYDSEMNMGLNEMHARYENDKLLAERDRYKMRMFILSCCIGVFLFCLPAFLIPARKRRRARLAEAEGRLDVAQSEGASSTGTADDTSGADASSDAAPSRVEDDEFMAALEARIRESMVTGKVDFEEIASTMCISRTHLNRKIKSITGGTTSDLVLNIRISTAKELLRSTSLPVWEIAEKCGINDPAYFSTLFKKAVGKSPGQYRSER